MEYGVSGIKPGLAPGLAGSAAAELDPIVQPIGPILPEFDGERQQAEARPVRRPRNCANREFRHVDRDRLLEGHPAFERSRLPAGPGADLGEARAGGEIRVGDVVLHALERAAQANLSAQALPMEDHGTFRCGTQFSPFWAV